ncbi:TIGR00269 family protein [Thermocrinis minervae]|uniref:TIGR00269 family protein n=1 Tax=Thermocrinis minervae TaxID=381751 RepID=A0A1M6TJ68_9AQUI|nr:TIGR00269 family protein [Thermocrinis minervae]SHK57132.1 TIGR00269 family protein [Thermocrinis minervae]
MRKCVKCNKKAEVYLPQYRLSLCREHYIEWFENRVEGTIREFRMFSKKDRILVAVSGGKDSLSLWNTLHKLGYQADGLYIDLGIGQYSEDSKNLAIKFANNIGRELHTVSLKEEVLSIPEIKKEDPRPACSFCGTLKRYYMNHYAKKLGYNVVATGHNLDDEVAVLFSNVLSWNLDYLKRQYPVLEEGKGFVRKVKPLCKMSEKESALYAFMAGIEYIEYECPFSEGSTSIEYKKLLSELEERHPGTKLRFYMEFLRKIYPLLNQEQEQTNLRPCKVCGEPTSRDVCPVCALKAKVGKVTEPNV